MRGKKGKGEKRGGRGREREREREKKEREERSDRDTSSRTRADTHFALTKPRAVTRVFLGERETNVDGTKTEINASR
jgi:hypothetical protein